MPADPTATLAIEVVLGVVCTAGVLLYARQEWRNRRTTWLSHPESAPRTGPPPDLAGMFVPRESRRIEPIAMLNVTTGKLVACDPLAGPDTPPLERLVPVGAYPVEVAIENDRHAALRVVFSEGTPVRWELAGGYGVDAGVGCVMDATTARLILERGDALAANEDYYTNVIEPELRDGRADHHPVAGRAENCVIVESGYGDGYYDSYWGLGEDGQLLQLVTVFA